MVRLVQLRALFITFVGEALVFIVIMIVDNHVWDFPGIIVHSRVARLWWSQLLS